MVGWLIGWMLFCCVLLHASGWFCFVLFVFMMIGSLLLFVVDFA